MLLNVCKNIQKYNQIYIKASVKKYLESTAICYLNSMSLGANSAL